MLKFWQSQVVNDRFEEILHLFPQCGHSFLPCDHHFGVLEKMHRKREQVECYEERMEMINKTFPVVEVKGFMIKDFVTGLGMSFLRKC
jgi:hypothetical protein